MEVREPSAKYLAKAAYKQTEVGLVPMNWDVIPLGRLVSSVEYGSSAKSDSAGQIPVLRMGNLQDGAIDWRDLVYTSDKAEIAKYGLRSGDVLFNRTNTIDLVGKTSIYKGEHPAIFAGYLIRIHVIQSLLNSGYLNYILNAQFSRKYSLKVLSIAVGQANINGQKLKTYPIPVPPTLAEQQAIAEALSDADALIESLEQLLAKKRQIKQGAMQELLTGKKRLSGFAGKWSEGSLGKVVGGLVAGVSVNSLESQPIVGTPCVLKTSALTSGQFLPSECKSIAPRDWGRAQTSVRGSSILISRMNTPDLVGEVGYVAKNYPWLFLPDRIWMTQFHPGVPINAQWLCYLLSSHEYKRQIQDMATGTSGSMKNISKDTILSLPILFPIHEEQTAIATLLSDMDAELTALEAKLAKACDLKQGMMQELLTGRIRLVSPMAEVIPFPVREIAKPASGKPHNWQINEAVVISVLTKHFGSEQWPLGRKRYTKLSYLLHRHVEHQAEGYLKKAAGPYNPATKYKGPEGIALKNGYIRQHARDQFSGFVAAEKIGEAEDYFSKWYGEDALVWLKQFRLEKNDELELLATVDMAMEDLRGAGKPVALTAVKQVIQSHPEWQAKLDRPIFSDANIERAIAECHNLFGN